MSQNEGWSFEAWRVCKHCNGMGKEPKTPWKAGTLIEVTRRKCTKCGDGPRPRYELKTFTLAQLAAALNALTKSKGPDYAW
jgi:hypothetical protein